MSGPRTLYDKIWDNHVVEEQEDGTVLLYIDCHLVLEVTSPQAFDGLRAAGRKVRRPLATIAVADHNVPTTDRSAGIADPLSRHQVETLERNVREFGIPYFAMTDIRQGIVHVIGPEQGFTATRHDGGVRRQPHRDARRLRRAGLRHRHVRSRARAGDADPDRAALPNMRVPSMAPSRSA